LILIAMTVFFVLRKGLRYVVLRLRPTRGAETAGAEAHGVRSGS
jgi:hypothetical protein